MFRPSALFVMGPTASGKTDLAIALRAELPVDLISVDSAMVYRGMDIGTAKPSPEELVRAPHRLIDICDPAEAYSAARFCDDALREMSAITASGRIPLLVGGTMLYFRALQEGLSALPRADAETRARLRDELVRHGLGALHARLQSIDPAAATRIHRNDPQRTLRALEVWEVTGRPLSELQAEAGEQMPYRALKLVQSPASRAQLHERIETRFERMLADGLVDEVRNLVRRDDLHPDLPSMRSVGYRQVWAWLRGEHGYQDMVERGKAATRQLAKRQMTWLRSERDAVWLDVDKDPVTQALTLWRCFQQGAPAAGE